jgi:hypothetical protein
VDAGTDRCIHADPGVVETWALVTSVVTAGVWDAVIDVIGRSAYGEREAPPVRSSAEMTEETNAPVGAFPPTVWSTRWPRRCP